MNWEQINIILAGISCLAIFSFLIKENAFYRLFEHLFVGVAAGWGVVVTFKNFLWPVILSPMLAYDLVYYPDGTLAAARNYNYFWYLLPISFGCLYYTVFFRRFSWLSKLVIGLSLGASAGLTFHGFFNQILPQLQSSFKPLVVFSVDAFNVAHFDFLKSFSNSVFVLTVLSVMYYFFFTFERTKGLASFATFGRYLMMICFGAYFGSTVMARMALLVERLQFLIGPWFAALKGIF